MPISIDLVQNRRCRYHRRIRLAKTDPNKFQTRVIIDKVNMDTLSHGMGSLNVAA